MKKLLILAFALTANLASAQSCCHVVAIQVSHEHRDHHHGYRSFPASSSGYWTTHYETVYVAGGFVAAINACGQTQFTFVPAHYETISRQVWVARSW